MRVRIGRVLFFGVLALALVAIALSDRVQLVVEDHAVARRKAERMFSYSLGRPLPGTPDVSRLEQRLVEAGHEPGAAVFVRIFKAESELELWLARGGRFERFATYPICRWSGRLGPKLLEGDRQAPEGFYAVASHQLNPNSRWHRSFNLGFPNALDRAHKRTGKFLMVHGGCSSVGCYAMTNLVMDEIWHLVTAALENGQSRIAVHVFPFRMTDGAMAARRNSPWALFWQDLKRGHDLFEASRVPPRVAVCHGRYVATAAGADGLAETTEAAATSCVDAVSGTQASGIPVVRPASRRRLAGGGKPVR